MLTKGEERYCQLIREKIAGLQQYLSGKKLPGTRYTRKWYDFLSAIKAIQGNLNNDISFIATLLAKEYLTKHFKIDVFDAAEKPQGAPGLDIDILNKRGERIVAEIKTTIPYNGNDFGAQQKKMIEKDLMKLRCAEAKYKFMFVIVDETFTILCRAGYKSKTTGIHIVQLLTGQKYNA